MVEPRWGATAERRQERCEVLAGMEGWQRMKLELLGAEALNALLSPSLRLALSISSLMALKGFSRFFSRRTLPSPGGESETRRAGEGQTAAADSSSPCCLSATPGCGRDVGRRDDDPGRKSRYITQQSASPREAQVSSVDVAALVFTHSGPRTPLFLPLPFRRSSGRRRF